MKTRNQAKMHGSVKKYSGNTKEEGNKLKDGGSVAAVVTPEKNTLNIQKQVRKKHQLKKLRRQKL